MKLVSQHMGKLLVAIASIVLIVSAISYWYPNVSAFFGDIVDKKTVVGGDVLDGIFAENSSPTAEQLEKPILFIEDTTLRISDPSFEAESAEIFIDGTSIGTVEFEAGNADYDLKDIPEGAHNIKVVVRAEGKSDNSATITYDNTGGSGSETSCIHENLTYSTEDSAEHSVYCDNCGDWLRFEPHTFDRNGYCQYCGQYNSSYDFSGECLHENVSYSQSGDSTHIYSCSDCSDYHGEEPHTFESGVCLYCGYDNYSEGNTESGEGGVCPVCGFEPCICGNARCSICGSTSRCEHSTACPDCGSYDCDGECSSAQCPTCGSIYCDGTCA